MPTSSMSKPALFCDRDGVVNQDPHPEPYVTSWDQWSWMPGIVDFLQSVKSQGYSLILVTSQRGVGKGLMTAAELEGIHLRMQEHLAAWGCAFDSICAYTGAADCRWEAKPDPGMILESAREMDLDLKSSWLIGDADRDIQMGINAGVPNLIRFRGLKGIGIPAEHTVSTLAEATEVFRTGIRG